MNKMVTQKITLRPKSKEEIIPLVLSDKKRSMVIPVPDALREALFSMI